ncbi:hypothetical protein [Nocardia sp. NPDC057668]|uniref:hypothetical protein n=1 Tax=Nocardia sp. NPDC057668 TaxID=3346202 RepID=UPI00366DE7B6
MKSEHWLVRNESWLERAFFVIVLINLAMLLIDNAVRGTCPTRWEWASLVTLVLLSVLLIRSELRRRRALKYGSVETFREMIDRDHYRTLRDTDGESAAILELCGDYPDLPLDWAARTILEL